MTTYIQAQFDKVRDLASAVTETKSVPKRFLTKRQADAWAKSFSKKYLTFWYVREVKPGQFEPWAHDLDDGLTVSSFYCGDVVNIINVKA